MVLVHPEYAVLVLEINELKDEIANLIVEQDMLKSYICKDMQVDYMLKIGSLEYKLMVAENDYKKNLRKLEVIDEKLAKNLKIDMVAIDKKINSEFKKQSKIELEMSEDIDLAIEISSIDGFDYDLIDEMNIDYFKLQKLYNPIFDLEESDEKVKFYHSIEKYYKKFNYKKLHKLAEKYDAEYMIQDEISNLKMLKEKYTDIYNETKREIRRIKNSFPYNQKAILEDENLYRRKKDNLNKEIIEINIENKKIEKKITNKLKKI